MWGLRRHQKVEKKKRGRTGRPRGGSNNASSFFSRRNVLFFFFSSILIFSVISLHTQLNQFSAYGQTDRDQLISLPDFKQMKSSPAKISNEKNQRHLQKTNNDREQVNQESKVVVKNLATKNLGVKIKSVESDSDKKGKGEDSVADDDDDQTMDDNAVKIKSVESDSDKKGKGEDSVADDDDDQTMDEKVDNDGSDDKPKSGDTPLSQSAVVDGGPGKHRVQPTAARSTLKDPAFAKKNSGRYHDPNSSQPDRMRKNRKERKMKDPAFAKKNSGRYHDPNSRQPDRMRKNRMERKTDDLGWQEISLESTLLPNMFPSDFVQDISPVDILSEGFDHSSLTRNSSLVKDDQIPYLGVLLDAGRHYFPIDWIKRMIDVISVMNFNLLHFRLTDDQTFNVQLKSQPRLAYPTTLNNNTKVYSPDELKDIVKYAKKKGIDIVPEINVPGHSGSWGGIPDLLVQCPIFICNKGYGIPLNVSNPKLRPILKDVLEEVIDIFDDPPYLHLGGDEVNMARPCFDEVGETMPNYNEFESTLRTILAELQYDESRVIRWEMSHYLPHLSRAGDITHFWYMFPGETKWQRTYPGNFSAPIFLSSGLYFDTNEEDSAYDVYVKTKRLKHLKHIRSPNLGIIGGTFELSTGFWHDRNVIGRLLAVSMGATGMNITNRFEFFDHYGRICRSIGFDDTMCKLYGVPPIRYSIHRQQLKSGGQDCVWANWIRNTCDRLTVEKTVKTTKQMSRDFRSILSAKESFWETYVDKPKWMFNATNNTYYFQSKWANEEFRGKRLVDHTGLIMDISRYPPDHFHSLGAIITRSMYPLGLNLIQLRLVSDFSFIYFSANHPKLFYKPAGVKFVEGQNTNFHPTLNDLYAFRNTAAEFGVSIMPEIAISTNAGGLYRSSFSVDCPNFLCKYGEYIPQNITEKDYIPLIFSLVTELAKFSSSKYIHLGHDEREMSAYCFLEATKNRTSPDFEKFETTLSRLLDFAGLTPDRVVRWENKEKRHYAGRFGDITQCRAQEGCQQGSLQTDSTDANTPWFGTVDVRRGGPFDIYSLTRDLASKSPTGLMAEIGPMSTEKYEANNIKYRLLAFSIGTLDLPVMTKDKFENFYTKACYQLPPNSKTQQEMHVSFCRSFATTNTDAVDHINNVDEKQKEAITEARCNDQSYSAKVTTMRDPETIATAISMQRHR